MSILCIRDFEQTFAKTWYVLLKPKAIYGILPSACFVEQWTCLLEDAVISLIRATILIIFASKNSFPMMGKVNVFSDHLKEAF